MIFAEQGLVGRNLKLERRLALVHGGGHIMAMVLTVAAFIVWYSAFTRNEARIDQTRATAQIAEARLLETRGPLDLKAVLPTLNAAHRLRLAAGEDSWFAWLDGLGISATPVLAPAAQNAYDRILLNRLLPVFAGRLAIRIDALLRAGNDALLDQVKQVFRTYWMLSDPGHFDRGEVEHAARNEVAHTFALDPTSAGELNQHFARLIELLPKPISVDQQFVGTVRSRLNKRPVVEQVYARLLREAAQNTRLRPIDLIGLVGSGQLEITQMPALQIAFPAIDEQEPVGNAAMIPGIFTREGFLNFVLPNLPLIARAEQNADWLLAGAPIDTVDIQQIALKVMDRYVNDYIRVWSNALSSIHVVKFDDLQRGSAIMRGLAGSQSTLQQVVSLVRDNSNLLPPGSRPWPRPEILAPPPGLPRRPPVMPRALCSVLRLAMHRGRERGSPKRSGLWPNWPQTRRLDSRRAWIISVVSSAVFMRQWPTSWQHRIRTRPRFSSFSDAPRIRIAMLSVPCAPTRRCDRSRSAPS